MDSRESVTPELLQALGFTLTGRMWKDSHGTFFYTDNVPNSLEKLKNVISGTAFSKGMDAGFKKGLRKAHTMVAIELKQLVDNLETLGNASTEEKPVRSSGT